MNSLRKEFDIPEGLTYLNAAYASPLPNLVKESVQEGVRDRASPWKLRPVKFFERIEVARDLAAKLLDTDSDGIAVVPSASYAVATACQNISIPSSKKVLLMQDQFPSNVYPWLQKAKEEGFKIEWIEKPKGEDWTTSILSKLTQEVAVLSFEICHWTDGSFFDLKAVFKKARELGIVTVLDVSQALGVFPISIRELQPDFLFSVCYKWMMGPYSIAMLYVSEKYREGKPLELSWLNKKDCENFAYLTRYAEDFQKGARRFDMGQKSNFVQMPMLETALKLLLEWQPPKVSEYLLSLSMKIEEQAEKLGLNFFKYPQRVPHIIGLKSPKLKTQTDLCERLYQQNIFVSLRCDSIRLSPHVYNSKEDIDIFFRALTKELG